MNIPNQKNHAENPVPPGLGRVRPRDVRLSSAGRVIVVLCAFCFGDALAAAFGLHLAAERRQAAARLFREHAVDAEGVVMRKWNTGDDRRIRYEFTANGRVYSQDARVRRSQWDALVEGSRIPVRFLRSDPSQSYPWQNEPNAMPAYLPFVIALSLAAIGGLCLVPIFRQRRLLAEGRPALARLIERRRRKSHGGKHYRFRYEFSTLGGAVIRGSTETRKDQQVGALVWVIYLPDEPRRNAVYPLELVRLSTTKPLRSARRSLPNGRLSR